MRPLALTSVTRRGARREQQEGATVADAGPPAPANDPHANTQLAQSLPRRPTAISTMTCITRILL